VAGLASEHGGGGGAGIIIASQ